MAASDPGAFGLELYADVAPLAWEDPGNGYALRTLTEALGDMFDEVRSLVRTDSAGNPGWTIVLDVDRCPTAFLPWLGQFVGVQVDPSLTDPQQRAQIRAETGMARGSVPAMVAAAQKYLTGSRTVQVIERVSGDAYALDVFTFTSETPDSTIVQAALTAAKPAGLNLTYTTVTGMVWAELEASYSTWSSVVSTFPTWQDVINNTP